MTRIRVGAAVLNQTPLDWSNNLKNILLAIEQARATGVRILCLPELCITGYGCEDVFHSAVVQEASLSALKEVLPATKGMIVSVGLPILHKHALFNCACLAVDGRIIGFAAKRFLAADGIHYEPRWFKAWPAGVRESLTLGGEEFPLGDLVFECSGVRIGFEICEDAWVAKRPGADMSLQGVDIILNPSASHFAFGKHEVRKRFVIEGSRAFGVSYVYANLLGNEAGRVIYDGGALIASAGRLLAAGPRFSFAPVQVTSAVIDVAVTRTAQARTGSFRPALGQDTAPVVACQFSFPDIEPDMACPAPAAWENSPHLKNEEFTRAIVLALFDYMRKSRSNGFVVSLSGGADSSAVSCLAALMAEMAHAELGEAGFLRVLNYMPALATARTTKERVKQLLHCVYQASANSSQETRDSARVLAEALGAQLSWFDADKFVDGYVHGMEKVIGRALTWENDDLTLQNIQARVRGPGVWLLANVQRALLLATSNRSEAAVGYATMDGDTCGGLSPIGGIDKAFLLQWLRWLETAGPAGVRAIPELAVVNGLAPTAELRPAANAQTDEKDLMPYAVLDAIERAAIRDKQPPREVFRVLRAQFPKHRAYDLHLWVDRFFRLWCRNQWKRERYAPSFHVDDENLDPKTWCRFPILSGGFARELGDLKDYAQER